MPSVKLTLNIDGSVIDRAKGYAKQKNVSLSKIVEHYLATLSDENVKPAKVSSWVKDLVAVKKPTLDFDHKSLYQDHILEKYSEE